MGLDFELEVCPRVAADGAATVGRATKDSSFGMQDTHARYQEAVYRGNVFNACNQAAVTFGVGLSATVATFSLYNPAGSGKLLVLWSIQMAFSAAPAAATVLYLAAQTDLTKAAPTGLTLLTNNNAMLGAGASSVGKAMSAATLAAAPVAVRTMGSIVAASSITPPIINDEIAGQIIIPQNGIVVLQATAACSGFISGTWEEIPV